MNIPRIILQLCSSFFMINIVNKYKSRSAMLKIKAAQAYVVGVKKMRLFFLGLLFILVSFVLLINGLVLLQTAFLNYSMLSNEMKFLVALFFGVVEFLGAVGIMIYLFREETWSRFCAVEKVVDFAIGKDAKDKDPRTDEI